MRQKLQQKTLKNYVYGPKKTIFRHSWGKNGIENILNASSIVVLQWTKYVVQKGSLFNVTLGNYATKTAKKQ